MIFLKNILNIRKGALLQNTVLLDYIYLFAEHL
jgi:hypothetical protein